MDKKQIGGGIGSGRGGLLKLLQFKESVSQDAQSTKPDAVFGRGGSLTGRGRLPGRGSTLASLLATTSSLGRGGGIVASGFWQTSRPGDLNQNVLNTKKYEAADNAVHQQVDKNFATTETNVQKKAFDKFKELKLDDQEENAVNYHGSTGSKIPLFLNCVKVTCRNDAVYQYHVDYNPLVDSKAMRFILLNQHHDVIGKTKAFDGCILYLPIQLSNVTTLKSKRLTDQVPVTITIQLTSRICPSSHRLIPFYNIVLRRAMEKLQMCAVGRNFYDPNCPISIDKYMITLWPGYVTVIKTFEGGLLLNIDVSHKVLRNETARHLMESLYMQNPGMFKENCVKELVGSIVLTKYNNKNYRVDDIAWDITPSNTFTTSKGETLSYLQYYKSQYGIEVKDRLQPMLVHRPKKKTRLLVGGGDAEERVICLIPELCNLTGLSDKLRSDNRAMKEIKNNTCLEPARRINRISEFLHRINDNEDARNELLRWGLELHSHPIRTNARLLESETVLVGNHKVFKCSSNADFSKEVSRSRVINPVPILNWILVFTQRDAMKARNFFAKFVDVCKPLGMEVSKPNFITLQNDHTSSYKDAIVSSMTPSVQLVVCIFPTSRDDRYSAVKKLCCVHMPVASQVILSRTLPDDTKIAKFRSVTIKIALQINCKLGGELWAVDIPLKDVMICGIDVYHPTGSKGNSVAAFVASTNKLKTRWFSKVIIQQPHQELMDSLNKCLMDSIQRYYEVNHVLPLRIIIFRDGVGDGQLKHVAEHEFNQLRSCLEMFDNIGSTPYNPKLTVVIVSKRINVKLFAQERQEVVNPPPGTVLDHMATRRNWPDFFVVSQHVRHGTVSPTHYIVVSGQEHLKPDHMQRLAYKMTYMYYNWPGTVRVPAPCQYAHKLAYLVGQNIHQQPSVKLSDQLFYL